MELILKNAAQLSFVIGCLYFMVMVITQVTKNISFLKKVPTDLYVIVLSFVLCTVSYFAYISYFEQPFVWYFLAGAMLCSFIIAFLVMYGWAKLKELIDRCIPRK